MKKGFILLLVFVFAVSLVACGKNDTHNNNTGENDAPSPTETQSTTAQLATTQPVKLNPKTDFKFGKYEAKYFDNDNQAYHEVSLRFYEDFESVEYQKEHFYTKELCKKRYQDREMEFNEDNFHYEYDITINGITYYNLGDYEILAEAYEITDTVIKVSPDFDRWGVLSLNADGTLVLDTTIDNNRYGPVGSIFTRVEE